MEESPSSEANRSSATQYISSLLWNQEFHYRVYKSLSRVVIQMMIDPIHAPPPTNHTSLKSILTSSSHLRLGLPSGTVKGFKPFGFRTSTLDVCIHRVARNLNDNISVKFNQELVSIIQAIISVFLCL